LNLKDIHLYLKIQTLSKYYLKLTRTYLRNQCKKNKNNDFYLKNVKDCSLNYYSILHKKCIICYGNINKFNKEWKIFIHHDCLIKNLKNIWYYPLFNINKDKIPTKKLIGYIKWNRKNKIYQAGWYHRVPFIENSLTIEYHLKKKIKKY